jgi:hypothetical protein
VVEVNVAVAANFDSSGGLIPAASSDAANWLTVRHMFGTLVGAVETADAEWGRSSSSISGGGVPIENIITSSLPALGVGIEHIDAEADLLASRPSM